MWEDFLYRNGNISSLLAYSRHPGRIEDRNAQQVANSSRIEDTG
jgi:hypothetical protein